MITPPNLPKHRIISSLSDWYSLRAADVTFLPLGADVNTAVFRVTAEDGPAYFLKLRSGPFEEITVTIPQFLKARGIQEIIAPLQTTAGQLWGNLDEYRMVLYPFIEGKDGYQLSLSDHQWQVFGAAMSAIHASRPPVEILRQLPRETYSSRWRDEVKGYQAQVEARAFADPTAAKLAAFMREKRDVISHVVARAGELGTALQDQSLDFVPCHTDIHPGNLFITGQGELYIVDWDAPILAPRERDLMFIGAGMGSTWDGERVERLFYQGYGPVQINRMALAYYRYERIVQDIAAFCAQLLLSSEGGEDREQSYRFLIGNFLPGREIDTARQTDPLA